MTLAILVLAATGYLSYRNFSAIVASMKVDLNPSLRLMNIRDLSVDLQNAENSVRIFSITGDRNDLGPYYKTIRTIHARIASLRTECMDDPDLLEQTDTIAALIDSNTELWNGLLLINSGEKVVEELKHISDQIDRATVIEPVKEEVIEKKVETGEPVKEETKKPGFFKRLFGRKKEVPADTVPAVTQAAPQLTIVESPPVIQEDTTAIKETPVATISAEKKEEIKSNIGRIQKDDEEAREKLAELETRIARTGNRLREKIYDLISRMESEARLMSDAKNEEADRLAQETFKWLLAFMITGTILALSVIITIISYVRKSDIYNSVIIRSRDEAEKLAKAKELFMANMSHEIRTPVTAIAGFTEQLLHDRHDERTMRTLGVIKSASEHLSRMINDVLDFSKMQNSKLSFENVNFRLADVFNEVNNLFAAQAAAVNTSLTWSVSPDTPPVLLGDPYRLRQVIINLVSNAVKFTKNGKVHYAAEHENSRDGIRLLVIKVTDTGIGIDEDKLNLIFDDFTQEEMSTTRKYGGTGLGLSIVKKIVEMQGGSVEVRSRKGHGTQITCSIPLREGDESLIRQDAPADQAIPEHIKEMRILIADDEEYNRMLFRMILERWGIAYGEAVNGAEAVEKLRSGNFDLVFMDARMPVMDGMEATRAIRNELKLDIPVICISAASTDSDGSRFTEAGMDGFLLKPFSEAQLLQVIVKTQNQRPLPAARLTIEDEDYGLLELLPDDEVEESAATKHTATDLSSIYSLAGDDKRFVSEMLSSFILTTEKGINEIESALAESNITVVAETAHRLIPPCRHTGAAEMCCLLKQIEEAARSNNDPSFIEERTIILRKRFAEARLEIEKELEGIADKV